jgi:hypothetical protein
MQPAQGRADFEQMREKFEPMRQVSRNGRPVGIFTERGRRHEPRRGRNVEPYIMSTLDVTERRRTPRHRLGRLATIKLGVGIAPRCCLVTNISAEGVQLHLNGIDALDEFVLLFPRDVLAQDGTYRIVWRNGNHVGAKFVSAATDNA